MGTTDGRPPLFVTLKLPRLPPLTEELTAQLIGRLNGLYPQLSKSGRLTIEMNAYSGDTDDVHMELRHSRRSLRRPQGKKGICPDHRAFVDWIQESA